MKSDFLSANLNAIKSGLATIFIKSIDRSILVGSESFDFDFKKCTEYIHMRNPKAKIFPISAKTGEGMEAVADWLKEEVRNWKENKQCLTI